MAAFGGIRAYSIDVDGEVKVEPVKLSTHALAELEANILMFYTGMQRSSSSVLSARGTWTSRGGCSTSAR